MPGTVDVRVFLVVAVHRLVAGLCREIDQRQSRTSLNAGDVPVFPFTVAGVSVRGNSFRDELPMAAQVSFILSEGRQQLVL